MKPPKEFRRTRVTVEGVGQFPLDMLRYDDCVPQTELEVAHLARWTHDQLRCVQLYRYSYDALPATAARWASIGWKVVSDEGRGK